MKKLLVLFPMFLFLVACSNTPAVGEAFDGTVNDYDGVTMTVVEGTAYAGTATVEILNSTDIEINSGNEADFGLQIEQDGKWYWLERKDKEYANTAEALIYEKNEPRELTVTWGNIYGSLEPGHYRVTKWFFEFSESGVGQEFLLASEITLD